ncbi:MAG: diaminopimelate epimerase [Candidatus Omnitrophica bacterium]|nr:diaminopimelate epimerase [Candidatus Omnitrophota bacterium]
MSGEIPFTKMVGTGNDFLVVDTVHHAFGWLKAGWAKVARAACDRRDGVGADGLLVLERSRLADVRMRVFNSDGSEAEMCGNGARCVAAFVHGWHGRRHHEEVFIETAGGLVSAQVHRDRVRMRMPEPRDLRLDLALKVDGSIRSLSSVDTGVPHVVAVVDHLDRVEVEALGRRIRFHQAFGPRGANVNFIEVNPKKPHHLRVRTYERGVEGETLACGTGAAAAAVVHALSGDLRVGRLVRRTVHEDGGAHAREADVRECHTQVETKSGETLTVSLSVEAQGRARPLDAPAKSGLARGRPERAEQVEGRRVTDVTLEGAVRWICEGTFRWH